jgi:hypothetical protein
LEVIVALLAVASIITVVQRFVYVHRHAEQVDEALRAEERMHAEAIQPAEELRVRKRAALDPLAKGHSSG